MVPPAGTPVRADRLRAVNVPRPVGVVCDGAGTPVAATGRPDGSDDGRTAVVTEVREMWLVQDEWWRPPGINRRYFDVMLDGGTHVILFEDLNTRTWYEQRP